MFPSRAGLHHLALLAPMAVVLSASVPTLASDPTRPDPGPQAASIRGMSCVGEEPFWGLEIGRTEARLSRPGAAGIDEIVLTGRLDTLDFLEPPAAVFRGDGREGLLVATMRRESCASTMSDQTPDRPWRAVVSFPDGSVATGCCSLAGADAARVAPQVEPDDWTRHLADLLPAIRACIADGRVPVEAVVSAWPMNRGMAGIRLRAPDGSRHDCIADATGSRVETLVPVRESPADAPAEGNPVFLPADPDLAGPPNVACGRIEEVLASGGALAGWLHRDPCPG